jgi:hypothetical protein
VDKVAGCREPRYCSYRRSGDLEEAAAAADALEAALDRGEALPIRAFTVGERTVGLELVDQRMPDVVELVQLDSQCDTPP